MRTRLLLPLALLAACSQPKPPAAAPVPPFHPTASIQELMQTLVDPAADALWDSVGSETGPHGLEEHQPRSDAEWQAVRRNALTLVEASNLLLIGNRAVSHGDKALEDAHVPGILTPVQVRQAIDADRGAFAAHALALQAAGGEALAAIDAHDARRLMSAGEKIDHACEGCHVRYWYPNAETPGWPARLGQK